MLKINILDIPGYERVIEARDDDAKLHAFIAIHDTTLGPALGGTRIFPYATAEEALEDALRLSKGMTYKSAVAEIGLGGGKSVIIGDPKTIKTKKLLHSFAAAINSLEGRYICAEDIGSTVEDMATIHEVTPYVAAMDTGASSGDPSPFTAWGVFRGLQAVAKTLWGHPSLAGRRIAIQGLGAVGGHLAQLLFWEGADLIVADVVEARCQAAATKFGATVVKPQAIVSTECDIFVPCAMGAVINDTTIKQLRCLAIAGSANNVLDKEKHGVMLRDQNILYAPDYVINAGGIINAAEEFEAAGYSPKSSLRKTNKIYDLLLEIFRISRERHTPTSAVANELAEYKIHSGIGKRLAKMPFHPATSS